MKKTDITIICSTVIPIFAIGVIAVLLWVFKEEVMKLWGKLKEKCGECIGGEKKVSNALDDVEVDANKGKTDTCDYCENLENTKQGAIKIWGDGCNEIREGYKEMKDDVNNILNILEKKIIK